MTSGLDGYEIYRGTASASQQKAQDAENSARTATCVVRYKTVGQGDLHLAKAITFNVKFTEVPTLTTGVFIERLPDLGHYRAPMVTVAVTEYTTEGAKGRYLYTGAKLLFAVHCDPLHPPRTDGSNLAALQAAYKKATVPADKALLKALVQEANEAKYLHAHPPLIKITHNLLFTGIAIKGLPSATINDLGRTTLDTNTPPGFGSTFDIGGSDARPVQG